MTEVVKTPVKVSLVVSLVVGIITVAGVVFAAGADRGRILTLEKFDQMVDHRLERIEAKQDRLLELVLQVSKKKE